jgi:hypothetical protein
MVKTEKMKEKKVASALGHGHPPPYPAGTVSL